MEPFGQKWIHPSIHRLEEYRRKIGEVDGESVGDVASTLRGWEEKQGCVRIQKSIFLADQPVAVFEQIKSDLAEVQACYDNKDSILVVPISTDYINSMKVIGQEICLDVIMKSKTTLFF